MNIRELSGFRVSFCPHHRQQTVLVLVLSSLDAVLEPHWCLIIKSKSKSMLSYAIHASLNVFQDCCAKIMADPGVTGKLSFLLQLHWWQTRQFCIEYTLLRCQSCLRWDEKFKFHGLFVSVCQILTRAFYNLLHLIKQEPEIW